MFNSLDQGQAGPFVRSKIVLQKLSADNTGRYRVNLGISVQDVKSLRGSLFLSKLFVFTG